LTRAGTGASFGQFEWIELNNPSNETVLTESPVVAARFIRVGELVAFPTETVYGLGADIFNESAVRSIFEAKQRPSDNPLIAHVYSFGQIELLAREISYSARKLIDAFFPGPITLVLQKRENIPAVATSNLASIGIRMPAHPVAREFLEQCGNAIVAPSANLSGRPSPTTWQAVYEDLNGRIACILQGDRSTIGLESTVIDCTVDPPVLLRPGGVGIEALRRIVPETRTQSIGDESSLRKSPGTRYRHYSPRARVRLVNPEEITGVDPLTAYIGLSQPPNSELFEWVYLAPTTEDYAHSLFDFFRQCDNRGLLSIYCEIPPAVGIGLALQDRLKRAAT
jgi:L-threonylcarbamoyladenylate synthase